MATIKMRCSRVSEFDSGTSTMREIQLVSTDREGQPLNPVEEVSYANFSGTFADQLGRDIDHDTVIDVTIGNVNQATPVKGRTR